MVSPLSVRAPLAILAVLVVCGPAVAQLVPDRTYYGIGRPVPMSVRVPPDMKEAGELTVQLLRPVSAEIAATATVSAGPIDLTGLFPFLWDIKVPRKGKDVLYAQLVVGQQKVGPAVVLQPLVDPDYCVYVDAQTSQPQFRPTRGIYSGLRAYIDQDVVVSTSAGEFRVSMRPDQAPNTVWNFRELVRGGFYTDIAVHRVIAKNADNQAPFMFQAGDPNYIRAGTGQGEGGPGYMIGLEQSTLPHDFGVLSMARNTQLPNSGGSQFFVCLSREGTAHLDGQFTTFATAISGADVLVKIGAVDADGSGRPREAVVIQECRLVNAAPYGMGPPALTRPAPAPSER